MFDDWVQSSAGLPCDGEQIEFLLDGRSVAMQGTYTLPAFHSHWAQYGVDRVLSWRKLTQGYDPTTAAGHQPRSVLSSTPLHDASQHPLLASGVIDPA